MLSQVEHGDDVGVGAEAAHGIAFPPNEGGCGYRNHINGNMVSGAGLA